MSTLWTPAGEHPVDRRVAPSGAEHPSEPTDAPAPPSASHGPETEDLERLQRELASAPPEVVVANHCYGLFELAAVYLSHQPEPLLDGARLAIDSLGYLVEGLAGRLGDQEPTLRDALAQVRLAFVTRSSGTAGGPGAVPGQEHPVPSAS